ncbi:uncharacterized protein C8A04DRAFT_32123 [Dichotomopilus funicola]|uniref:Uncharacterized protein n=1 Tax=Dichotomopilus funicola TaxID=1934379 RepID=A0AAN6UYS3_9PEZI|nr:hypothetical protein C8A04DRAFT_32123 [Dichotomopilus funicola]
MKNSFQIDGGAPPPYSEAVGPVPNFRHEKASATVYEAPVVATPARSCFLRRIWRLLTTSRVQRRQQRKSRLAEQQQQAPRTIPSPTPQQQQQPDIAPDSSSRPETGRWEAPESLSTVQRTVPMVNCFQYTISSQHCPIDFVTPDDVEAAPWIAEVHFGVDDLNTQLPLNPPWAENIHRCWQDKISAEEHPLLSDERLFVRRIEMGYSRVGEAGRLEWAVAIDIWHQDAQWLADLPYEAMAAMTGHDSMIRASGTIFPVDKPLESGKVFYLQFPKPVEDFYCEDWPDLEGEKFASESALLKVLGVDRPELREQLGRFFNPPARE